MRIGTDYYFRQGFKGKLGCVLYRGFAIEPFEQDKVIVNSKFLCH